VDIRQYQKEFDRLHARLERKVAPIFHKALITTVTPVLSSLNENDLLIEPWIVAYRKVYESFTIAAKKEYQQLKRENPTKDDISVVDFFNEQWRLIMQKYGNDIGWDFATDLNDTTIKQIRKAIAEGNAEYATNTQLARLIKEYTLGLIGKQRSLLIARTETTTGTNLAKIEGAKTYFKEIGESQGYKMWISRADSHVRHDHVTVNETAVPFEDNFIVGGFEAIVPGDPKLPAKERIRCRCTFVSLSQAGYNRRFKKS